MGSTKRRLVSFRFHDQTGIESYLTKQAEKGWLLDRMSAFGWRFRRIEPQKLHFSVTYFPAASAFDPEPSEDQIRFREFCAHTGWELAGANAQLQIFYNARPDPTPIETDARMEIDQIHAAAKKSFLPSYYLLTAVGLLQAVLWFFRLLSDPITLLPSGATLISGLCWLLMLVLCISDMSGYYRWRRRAIAAAERDGSFLNTHSNLNMPFIVLALMLLAYAGILISYGGSTMAWGTLLSLCVVFAVTGAILGLSALMKRMKLSARFNRTATIVISILLSFGLTGILTIAIIGSISRNRPEDPSAVTYEFQGETLSLYRDDLPLTIEDLIELDFDGYSYRIISHQRSPLMERMIAFQQPRLDALQYPDLEYTVTTVKAAFLYDMSRKALLADFVDHFPKEQHSCSTIDAAPWGAKEAYQLRFEGEPQLEFLLFYDDRVVEIDFEDDWILTEKQMAVVGEKLGK